MIYRHFIFDTPRRAIYLFAAAAAAAGRAAPSRRTDYYFRWRVAELKRRASFEAARCDAPRSRTAAPRRARRLADAAYRVAAEDIYGRRRKSEYLPRPPSKDAARAFGPEYLSTRLYSDARASKDI